MMLSFRLHQPPRYSVLLPSEGKALKPQLLDVLRSQPGPHGRRMKDRVVPSMDDLSQIVRVVVPRGSFRLCLQDNQRFREEIRYLVTSIAETHDITKSPKNRIAVQRYVAEAKAVGAGVYRGPRGASIGSSAAARDQWEAMRPYISLAVILLVGSAAGVAIYRGVRASKEIMNIYAEEINSASQGHLPRRAQETIPPITPPTETVVSSPEGTRGTEEENSMRPQ